MIFSNNLARAAGAVTNLFSKTDKIKFLPVEQLRVDEEYKALYQQEEEKVQRIADDMRANGYDKSQPIIVLNDNTIVDGHSRYQAALKAGLKSVPIIYKNISEKNDVLAYMEHLQLDRRNLTDAEKIKHYENLMRLKEVAKTEGKSVEKFSDESVAKQLNISSRQVQKIREVEKKATSEQLEAVKKGDATINQIHSEIKSTESTEKPKTKTDLRICIEFSGELDGKFLGVASKTNKLFEALAAYLDKFGLEEQSALLRDYTASVLSLEASANVWNAMIVAISNSKKHGLLVPREHLAD